MLQVRTPKFIRPPANPEIQKHSRLSSTSTWPSIQQSSCTSFRLRQAKNLPSVAHSGLVLCTTFTSPETEYTSRMVANSEFAAQASWQYTRRLVSRRSPVQTSHVRFMAPNISLILPQRRKADRASRRYIGSRSLDSVSIVTWF